MSCIGVLGLSFVGYHLINCGLYWNEISDKLAKQSVMKSMSKIYDNLLLSSHEITSVLEKTVYKQIKKTKFAIIFLFKVSSKSCENLATVV